MMSPLASCTGGRIIQGSSTIATKRFHGEFVGSFYALSQLPRDSRPQIALAGRSNVGKSTLLNRLVGQKNLAKVSATPGKTRSLNFFLINDTFYLVDLPGYGFAKVSKSLRHDWGKLIEDFLTKGPHLIGLVLLIDVRRDVSDDDVMLLDWLAARKLPALAVITKTDKVTRDQMNRKVRQIEQNLNIPAIPFSAISGLGKDELIRSVHYLISEYAHR